MRQSSIPMLLFDRFRSNQKLAICFLSFYYYVYCKIDTYGIYRNTAWLTKVLIKLVPIFHISQFSQNGPNGLWGLEGNFMPGIHQLGSLADFANMSRISLAA